MSHSGTDLTELHWNQLLDFIEAGTVVPVLGRELLWTEINGSEQNVYSYIASRLGQELGVHAAPSSTRDPVSDVVHRYLATRQDPAWPYAVVFKIVKELANIEPPASVMKLAEIDFPILISTTFDGLLERAVEKTRSTSRPAVVISYFLNSSADLPALDSRIRVVFNLLGRACPTPDYSLTDADVIEFVRQFQSGKPRRLLDTLGKRHLLVIGNGFPDWLARFFLRLARPTNSRLWMNTQSLTHYIADRHAIEDTLLKYLQHPLSASCVFPATDANTFVSELHERWRARHPSEIDSEDILPPVPVVARRRCVFLSYANADLPLAKVVCDVLDKSGLDAWFDKQNLHAGDDWDKKIRRAVDESLLFIPLISQHTLTNEPDKYFRAEWRYADIHALRTPFNVPYIFPIIIDDTSIAAAREYVPELFVRVQWTMAANGTVPDEFIHRLKQAYRKLQRSEGMRA